MDPLILTLLLCFVFFLGIFLGRWLEETDWLHSANTGLTKDAHGETYRVERL